MADSSKSLIECVSDDSDEDEDTVESDSCKKVSIFRAFSARFGSIFGILHQALVTTRARQHAGDSYFHTPRFNSSSTRVTGLHPKKVKQAS